MAPEWDIAHWFNTPAPISLHGLRGRPVFAVAFQMLCPGCVSQGLPQAQRVASMFADTDLAVIGLHTVFEHHEAQGSHAALAAFLHEYRIKFPVGLDAPAEGGGPPRTMRLYGMRGTPTTLLFDRAGTLRLHQFGHLDDMRVGAAIATVLSSIDTNAGCEGDVCSLG